MRIYLVGFMGAGKSFFGKKLAKVMGFNFIDLDQQVERNQQMSITSIFEQYGATHFRKLEKKELLNTKSQKNCIIATGGGTPCFHNNMTWINQHGCSIYLQATPHTLTNRLTQDTHNRPLIKDLNLKSLHQYIQQTLEERRFFYEQAHLVIHQNENFPQVTTTVCTILHKVLNIKKQTSQK